MLGARLVPVAEELGEVMPARKMYVGDGVYVEFIDDFGSIDLTTENGLEVTNRIQLEPEVWTRLVEIIRNRRDAEDATGLV